MQPPSSDPKVDRSLVFRTPPAKPIPDPLYVRNLPTRRRRPSDSKPGIVSKTGNIRGCFPDVFDGVTVSDKLRELLVNPDSENADAFSATQQEELLFHVFRALSVGGGVCQPDDSLEPYTKAAKALYKVHILSFHA